MPITNTRAAHTPGPATATNTATSGVPTSGVPTNGSHPALHLRSFVAGAVLALVLAGAATLALRWTPAPAIVLHAPPTAQPPATPGASPTAAARSVLLPTPTRAAAVTSAADSAQAPTDVGTGRSPAEDLPARGLSPVHPALVNLNTATGAELEALPGIGPAKAQAIIAHRPYNTVEDLDGVPGIGPATLESLRPLVVVE